MGRTAGSPGGLPVLLPLGRVLLHQSADYTNVGVSLAYVMLLRRTLLSRYRGAQIIATTDCSASLKKQLSDGMNIFSGQFQHVGGIMLQLRSCV